MAWKCELTGKKALVGHNVSHANNKTKRRFLPNLRNITMMSDTLERTVSLRISTNALRTIDHKGGLDAFLIAASETALSDRARRLKREILKKQASA